MKTDYYELLEVSVDATDSDLKKAYRRKALQLHPDKNPDDIEGATSRFAMVRAAYEVLSDPQERSWYDSHKNQILNDSKIVETDNDDFVIPSISVEEIYRYFNPSFYSRVDDSLNGFYYIVGSLFTRLASEELEHGKYQNLPGYNKYQDNSPNVSALDDLVLLFPRFGTSGADYSTQVRRFYSTWASFQTVKTFSWKDEYRLTLAPDRKTRRLMEKENKKFRDNAKKEYNETIRNFVQFIKKRDPRVKQGIADLEKEKKRKKQEEVQNQIKLTKQNRLKELASTNDFQVQDWQELSLEELNELDAILQEEYASSSDSEFDEFEIADEEVNIFECVVCDKIFKNDKQFKIHEASKNHRKALNKLQYEMRKEGIDLGIDEGFETAEEIASSSEADTPLKSNSSKPVVEAEMVDEAPTVPVDELPDLDDKNDPEYQVDDIIESDFGSSLDDEVPVPKVKSKRKKASNIDDDLSKLVSGVKLDSDDDSDWGSNKKGKKKAKKKDKKSSNTSSPQPQAPPETTGSHVCATCKNSFLSRNKLFQHVQESGHAAPIKGGKKKKR